MLYSTGLGTYSGMVGLSQLRHVATVALSIPDIYMQRFHNSSKAGATSLILYIHHVPSMIS